MNAEIQRLLVQVGCSTGKHLFNKWLTTRQSHGQTEAHLLCLKAASLTTINCARVHGTCLTMPESTFVQLLGYNFGIAQHLLMDATGIVVGEPSDETAEAIATAALAEMRSQG